MAAGAVLGYVAVVDPSQPGHYPVCPLYRHTGLFCPGCGGLRGLHRLTHGDLPGALQANAPVVLGCLLAAVLWGRWLLRTLRPASAPGGERAGAAPTPTGGRTGARRPAPAWLLGGGLLAAFTLLRNLPVGPFGALLTP